MSNSFKKRDKFSKFNEDNEGYVDVRKYREKEALRLNSKRRKSCTKDLYNVMDDDDEEDYIPFEETD